jgi:hypothetical protein
MHLQPRAEAPNKHKGLGCASAGRSVSHCSVTALARRLNDANIVMVNGSPDRSVVGLAFQMY